MLEHGVTHLAIFDVDEPQGVPANKHLSKISEETQPDVVYRSVDVTNEESVNRAVGEICKRFGGIDVLLCFAGITGSKLAVEYPIEEWRRIMDVNVNGWFLVARAVARSVLGLFSFS